MLELFESYLLVEKRFSDHTILAYKKDLEQFSLFAEMPGLNAVKEINHHLIRAWIVEMIDNGITARSVNRKLSCLRSFLKWAQREKHIGENPMLKITAPKQTKRLPSFVKQSELEKEKLLPLFTSDFDGKRDQLMIELFYQTGIRLSELINLQEKDISSGSIKVLGKRNKERIIPISDELKAQIQQYIQIKKATELRSEFLLVLNNDNKLYPKFVYRKINYYLGAVTSMEKRSPHILRHTFATHMLNNGAGLEVLKDILGHANLSATQVYTHNSFAQLTNIYSQAHPRGHKND
jgi:integrase/recombinase XerC